MKNKILTIVILILLFSNLSFAQSNKIELSKAQMYADYDEFCTIMENVNPQLTLRKKVTGIDILNELKKRRSDIDTITNPAYFLWMLIQGVRICDDGHTRALTKSKDINNFFKEDTLRASKLSALYNQSKFLEHEFESKYKFLPLSLEYFEGKYYNIGQFISEYKGIHDSLPLGSQIISVGLRPIDSLISLNAQTGSVSWDPVLQKQYLRGSLLVPNKDTITIDYYYNGDTRQLKYIVGSTLHLSGGSYFLHARNRGFVEYFAEQEILYIRLPCMNDGDFYVNEILKYADSSIKKVVIDIRQNGGGSDFVWMDILKAIIHKPLYGDYIIGLKNTAMAKEAYGRDDLPIVSIPLLDDEEFMAIEAIYHDGAINPSSETINYSGKIYLLQDKLIYSSAGSLSNVAFQQDDLISIGQTTGQLLGFGIAPVYFTLQNSCFTFSVEPVLDLSNASTPWDLYHDNIEVPVNLTIQQSIMFYSVEDPYSNDFLFNHDPVFQKALEL